MKKIVIIICLILFSFLPALAVFAEDVPENKMDTVRLLNPIAGIPDNPEGNTAIPVILGLAIQKALGILGSAALLMFVIGGFMWLTSAGNAEKVKKGTQTMMWAVVGVFIIFSSYAILNLVLEGLGAERGKSESSAPSTDQTTMQAGSETGPSGGGNVCKCVTIKTNGVEQIKAIDANECDSLGDKGTIECLWMPEED